MHKSYQKEKLTIHWEPERCQHAQECVNGAPKVFDRNRRPWIVPENGDTKEIMRVINRCPSGALSYTYDGVEEALANPKGKD